MRDAEVGRNECQTESNPNQIRFTRRGGLIVSNQIQGGAAGRTEQGRHADRTELGKLQAHVNDEGSGKIKIRAKIFNLMVVCLHIKL